jgi:hypothetical protein
MLTIGQKVRLDEAHRNKFIKRGWFFVQSLSRDRVYLKKEGVGYVESIAVWDLRKGNNRLVTEDMKAVHFKPLQNAKEVMKQKKQRELKEYQQTTGTAWTNYEARKKVRKAAEKMAMKELELENKANDPENILVTLEAAPALDIVIEPEVKNEIIQEGSEIMLKMTKKEVLEMAAAGKTIDEIVEHFTQGDNKHRSMYTAKATLFLNGPKEKLDGVTKEKVKQEAPKMPAILKTRLMEDTKNVMRFELADEVLMINQDNEIPVSVAWDELDAFINNLRTIKQIHEAV